MQNYKGHKIKQTKTKTNTEPPQIWVVHKTTNQQQQQNHCLRTGGSLSHRGGLNAFYWRQISAIESVVVKTKKISSHGGFLTNATHHHRETI